MVDKLVDKIYTKVKKEKGVNRARYKQYAPDMIQQFDLLFLPSDKGYRYALIGFDLGSRMTDAEKLKNKTSSNVLKGFQRIYERGILKKPLMISVDSGLEFRGVCRQWLEEQGIKVKVNVAGRHRQNAYVERRNGIIAKILFKNMVKKELQTGKKNVSWITDINDIIKELNEKEKKKGIKQQPLKYACKGGGCLMLKPKTVVYVALDNPENIFGKREHGRFREADHRFSPKERIIKEVIIQPNQPVYYLLDDGKGGTDRRIAYTKAQLLPKF